MQNTTKLKSEPITLRFSNTLFAGLQPSTKLQYLQFHLSACSFLYFSSQGLNELKRHPWTLIDVLLSVKGINDGIRSNGSFNIQRNTTTHHTWLCNVCNKNCWSA